MRTTNKNIIRSFPMLLTLVLLITAFTSGAVDPFCRVRQLSEFIRLVYLDSTSYDDSEVEIIASGYGLPLTTFSLSYNLGAKTSCENSYPPVLEVQFNFNGEKLVGLAAAGSLAREEESVSDEIRQRRRNTAIKELRMLFGWGELTSTRVDLENSTEVMRFSIANSDYPVNYARATLSMKTGRLLTAGGM